jgi:hypothetical protein
MQCREQVRRLEGKPFGLTGEASAGLDRRCCGLRDAPAQLRGYIHGMVAFLRADPSAACVAFPVIAGERYRTIVLADGWGSSLVPSRPVDNSNWKPLA